MSFKHSEKSPIFDSFCCCDEARNALTIQKMKSLKLWLIIGRERERGWVNNGYLCWHSEILSDWALRHEILVEGHAGSTNFRPKQKLFSRTNALQIPSNVNFRCLPPLECRYSKTVVEGALMISIPSVTHCSKGPVCSIVFHGVHLIALFYNNNTRHSLRWCYEVWKSQSTSWKCWSTVEA